MGRRWQPRSQGLSSSRPQERERREEERPWERGCGVGGRGGWKLDAGGMVRSRWRKTPRQGEGPKVISSSRVGPLEPLISFASLAYI